MLILSAQIAYGQTYELYTDSVPIRIYTLQETDLGFDDSRNEAWIKQFEHKYHHPHVALDKGNSRIIYLLLKKGHRKIKNWKFKADSLDVELYPTKITDSTYAILLPAADFDYQVHCLFNNKEKERIIVHQLEKKTIRLTIVPIGDKSIDVNSINDQLNKIYAQANLTFQVRLINTYTPDSIEQFKQFDNPSPENIRYTSQMRKFRDQYIERFPNYDRESYYVFVIDRFVDSLNGGYMPVNKAMAFVPYREGDLLGIRIARELGHGIGMLNDSWANGGPFIGTTKNLMDTTHQSRLTFWQWERIQHSSESFSFFDEDEDLKTNNGMVAYYFWKEDSLGIIHLNPENPLLSIHRPYKKNYRSYHLNVEDLFFTTLFNIDNYFINVWHILVFGISIILWFIFRRIIIRKIDQSTRINHLWIRPTLALMSIGLMVVLYFSFQIINEQIKSYEIRGGYVLEFKNKDYNYVNKAVLYNTRLKHKDEDFLQSEILCERDSSWFIKHRKKVLYFKVKQDSLSQWTLGEFYHDDDSLIVSSLGFKEAAESHYFVFSYEDSSGTFFKQRVFNHIGLDITEKLNIEEPAKRILLFVNGYRPTSLGANFEEYFDDIKKNGLEYENSKNLIYDFDRYDYWHPWKKIDQLFKKRINPTETYFADGHFSVETSNHRNLLAFSTNAEIYPDRCANPKHHTCYETNVPGAGFFGGTKVEKTTTLLATRPNKDGFELRKEKGKIAGKNLLMMLNEFPNKASNDTLYIVAHSMGFAYAQGIIEELRGKINFGGFYIIAPENGESGAVNSNEWGEVWQYGVSNKEAPCLQDGVAPQTKVGELPFRKHIFIPKDYYTRKGYFDSHFIGYYTWIFDIPEGEDGAIKQH